MKNALKLFALFTATAFPALAFATVAGLPVPSALNAETGLALFASVMTVLTVLNDYARRARRFDLKPATPVLLPAREAFGASYLPVRRRATAPRTFRAPSMSA